MQQIKLETKPKSKVLEGLNDEQTRAVTHGKGPLLIVAGAGTGKTTVITRRVAYLIEQGAEPEQILAVTFTEKAAEEMRERVDMLLPMGFVDVNISTFHAFGERILRDWGLTIGLPDFEVLDEVGQWLLIKNNLEEFDLDYYKPLGSPTRFIKALIKHFSRAKDELISVEEYLDFAEGKRLDKDQAEAGVDEKTRLTEVARAYHVYQQLLLMNSKLDFGDLINYPLELFKKRPEVLAKLREQYKYILVDEFQDTNLAQYKLVKLLAAPKNNITVVGDDDQSIFKFRGASLSNIMHFKEDFPEAKSVALVKNYRNGQKILDAAYGLISRNNPNRLEVKLGIDKKLQSTQKKPGTIEQLTAPDQFSEAGLVIGKIIETLNQYSELTYNDFVILARSHSSFEPFIRELDRRGIPYMYAASEGLYRKPLILHLLSYFKLLDNYHESEALYRVLKLPVFGLSEQALVELTHEAKKKAQSLFETLKQASTIKALSETDLKGIQKVLKLIEQHTALAREKNVNEVYRSVVEDLKLARMIEGDYHNQRFIEAFTKKIQNFLEQSADHALRAFLAEIEFEQEAGSEGDLRFDPEAGPEAVKLLTVHSAKGLEFGNVFIVGLVDKRFPSISRREPIELPDELIKEIIPEGERHLEEERRLFYVAMTRARYNLYLTRAYDLGGKRTKKPSRFLIELGLAEEEKSKPTGEVELKKEKKSGTVYTPPKTFSFTQISTFKKCPLEYKYRYLLKIPPKGSPQLSFGRTTHLVLEKFLRLYKTGRAGVDLFGRKEDEAALPGFEKLKELYERHWIDEWYNTAQEKEQYFKQGLLMLKDFYDELKEQPPEVKELETKFKTKIGTHDFVGKIDRIDESEEGPVVIDYKTGKSRDLGRVDKDQLLLYQKAVSEKYDTPVSDLQYWYLSEGLEKKSFIGKESDIKTLGEKLAATASEIIKSSKKDLFLELDQRTPHRQRCRYQQFEL